MRALVPVAAVFLVAGLAMSAPAQQAPPSFLMAACTGETTRIADVTLPHAVMADGKVLPAGTYEVRATTQHPAPTPGTTADASCWVQFLREGSMQGRELATVFPSAEVAAVAKGTIPAQNTSRVELLKGGEYYRIWINYEGTHYIINVPPAS